MNRRNPATFAAHPMSRADLETTAESYLRRMYPQNLEVPTPLNVVKMMDRLEEHFGVKFGVNELENGEEGVTDPFEPQIILAPSVYAALEAGDGRARHTACHEVGHIPHISQVNWILRDGGPHLARRFHVYVEPFRDPEWQAHGIGSALLMPRMTAPSIYRGAGLRGMAEFFGVTVRHAEVRVDVLRKLGVL